MKVRMDVVEPGEEFPCAREDILLLKDVSLETDRTTRKEVLKVWWTNGGQE